MAIYDVLRYSFITIGIPAIHNFASNYISYFKKISTFQLSIILAFLVTFYIIVKRIFSWGRNIFNILSNTKVFYFRHNALAEDKTKNKELLLEQCKKAKDIFIIGATGFQTFARKDSEGNAILREVVEEDMTGEIKILLLHPSGEHTINRAKALGVPIDNYQGEIKNSIKFLKELKAKGKNVALKLYTQKPIWKMIILDNFLWLQYYHLCKHVERMPVYGISRATDEGTYSLFDPLYAVFQKKWHDDNNPIFDFTTDELVYFADGKREPLKLS